MELFEALKQKKKTVAVIGLGYVGLPLALEFAKKYKVIGFDINLERVKKMQNCIDPSNEISPSEFKDREIQFTANEEMLAFANLYIIGVPTDINKNNSPNLAPLLKACKSIGRYIKKGDFVIFESTVYPGCTEEDCVPLIESISGLHKGKDFKFGYSPERINPGDKKRTLPNILKIVSGSDLEALEQIAKIYGSIINAGIYRAPSIKVAEAAKVIENTQRDLNISLMNELAIIFDKMSIDTTAVINAASTKWNFHKYYPGLVGGHCISIDPHYLLHKARQLGLEPQVIAAGRRVNDFIPHFIAKRIVQELIEQKKNPGICKILVMGVTFKENVSDIRNSKVIDLIKELEEYSIQVHVVDPYASEKEMNDIYGIRLYDSCDNDYDAIVIAVGHEEYKKLVKEEFENLSNAPLLLFDIKGIKEPTDYENYWKL